MNISEKVAYLKGLAEGLEIKESSKEGRMVFAIIDVLSEMVDSIDCLEFDMDIISNEVDSLEEELQLRFDEEIDDLDDDYDDYEGEIYEVTCPKCGETMLLDEEDLDEGELTCAKCHEPLEIDFEMSEQELGE